MIIKVLSYLHQMVSLWSTQTWLAWWYCPLQLISREVEYILNWYNTFHQLLMAW
jgi:hypothetical protein